MSNNGHRVSYNVHNKMNLKIIKFLTPLSILTPFFANAAESIDVETEGTIEGIITKMTLILGDIIPVLLVIATLVFIWGVIVYILAGSSEERKKQGYNLIIWGLLALFLIVTMWGLVVVIGRTFDIGNESIPVGPELN